MKWQTEFLNSSGESRSIYHKRASNNDAKWAVTSAAAKAGAWCIYEVQLTNLVKLENCGVSPVHSIHHTKRYLAVSSLLCLLAK